MALADAYGCLLLDLDGVLYRGDEPVPGAPHTMAAIRERGIPLVFITNNSARTPTNRTRAGRLVPSLLS